MRQEVVDENRAIKKRQDAWNALQSLAKDHELAMRLKQKRQERIDFFTKRQLVTRQTLQSRKKEEEIFIEMKNLDQPRASKNKKRL